MIKNQLKSQKPIEVDVSFKYVCPADNCDNEHWIFLRQAKVKNFKIVCECGCVFKTKQIRDIKIIYEQSRQKKKDREQNIPSNLVKSCCDILVSYGFDHSESIVLIKKAYALNNNNNDIGLLVKTAIKLFGEKNG